MKKLILQIVLGIAIVVLVYFVYESIMGPVRFNSEKDKRREMVINRLKEIRDAELAYKSVNGRYTGSFDTLITFVTAGKIPIIMFTADPNDSTFTNPIKDTVGYIAVMDSIFKDMPNFKPEELRYIPYSDEEGGAKVEFEINAGMIDKGKVKVAVVEVFAANKHFLVGMPLARYNVDPEDGLRMGSMSEPTTDGNWE